MCYMQDFPVWVEELTSTGKPIILPRTCTHTAFTTARAGRCTWTWKHRAFTTALRRTLLHCNVLQLDTVIRLHALHTAFDVPLQLTTFPASRKRGLEYPGL